uniref:Carboxymuconolactone decarboxylase-like domain-containing protein n=1 Tax=Phaeomonas parva TaxID=124430 RepID=A0A7S1TYA7_9STRA|mmetsp:Transcript_22721/g.70345  ORF Transcript_22721/g.70345 Transcript_22721/m.70345 type:complete len:140 (+) Transcript_22721:359-778(+)
MPEPVVADARRPGSGYPRAVFVKVGAHWRSQFEWYTHERLALKAGLSPEAIAHIKAVSDLTEVLQLLDPTAYAALAFTRELQETARVSDATYAALVDLVGERGAVDVVFTAGYYDAVCRMLNAFEVALPPGAEPPFPES